MKPNKINEVYLIDFIDATERHSGQFLQSYHVDGGGDGAFAATLVSARQSLQFIGITELHLDPESVLVKLQLVEEQWQFNIEV